MYARLIVKIVPQPDVSYFLDADPIQARARKPEYPLDFLYSCREAYLTLSAMLGTITVIPPKLVRDVEDEILKHISFGAEREPEAQQPVEEPRGGEAA
jgi:thymidylate kinase